MSKEKTNKNIESGVGAACSLAKELSEKDKKEIDHLVECQRKAILPDLSNLKN